MGERGSTEDEEEHVQRTKLWNPPSIVLLLCRCSSLSPLRLFELGFLRVVLSG